MLEELSTNNKVVGLKQSRRALKDGIAEKVFLAHDANGSILREIEELCRECGVVCEFVPTMDELGRGSGISVGAAVAAVLRQKSDS